MASASGAGADATRESCGFYRARKGLGNAVAVALLLVSAASAGALAQTIHDGHNHPDVVLDVPWRPRPGAGRADVLRNTGARQPGRIRTTADNQILVELARGDTTPANLFDLNRRTVVFPADGRGGYSLSVRPVAWVEETGPAVADGAEIHPESFRFDFAGRRWGSFFVSRHGLITFGRRPAYRYWDSENRFHALSQIAARFVTTRR